jgi:hypothetical protein
MWSGTVPYVMRDCVTSTGACRSELGNRLGVHSTRAETTTWYYSILVLWSLSVEKKINYLLGFLLNVRQNRNSLAQHYP